MIVGASLAGVTAAAILREEGFEGRVVLVGAEEHLPYERPGLSKGYLRGEETVEDLVVRDADWFDDQDVELHARASRRSGSTPRRERSRSATGSRSSSTRR